MYETSYSILRASCIKTVVNRNCEVPVETVITWGKPSEIGIIYLESNYPNSLAANPVELSTREKILPKLGMMGSFAGESQQVVIKSRGILPTLKTPLKVEKFTPISGFISHVDLDLNNKIIKTGSIKIISVRKLTLQQEKTIFNSSELTYFYKIKAPVSMGVLSLYYKHYEGRPDIKPQQVDKITWQEGQPPQVIPLRK